MGVEIHKPYFGGKGVDRRLGYGMLSACHDRNLAGGSQFAPYGGDFSKRLIEIFFSVDVSSIVGRYFFLVKIGSDAVEFPVCRNGSGSRWRQSRSRAVGAGPGDGGAGKKKSG